MDFVQTLPTSETYGLPYKRTLKVTATYMMTNNVDTGDGLVKRSYWETTKDCFGKTANNQQKPVRI